jgi:ribose transport system substrate-binding protein
MSTFKIAVIVLYFSFFSFLNGSTLNSDKKILYVVSDIRIPFWDIMSRGIVDASSKLGYKIEVASPHNDPKKELEIVAKGIKEKVSGIVVSPTTSSACATILKLAKKANIPVVISDIGTDSGDYLSYISSNNKEGAYNLGKILTKKMVQLGYKDGEVGIIAIPQKRLNGQLRTEGFLKALSESRIKSATLYQQKDFSYQETYNYAKEMIGKYPKLKAIWLQGSDRYQGALDAIAQSGKDGKILLIVFDAEPEFLELIPKGVLVGAAMQQPYLMGQESILTFDKYFHKKPINKNMQLSILAVSKENIKEQLPIIKRNVLGIVTK